MEILQHIFLKELEVFSPFSDDLPLKKKWALSLTSDDCIIDSIVQWKPARIESNLLNYGWL